MRVLDENKSINLRLVTYVKLTSYTSGDVGQIDSSCHYNSSDLSIVCGESQVSNSTLTRSRYKDTSNSRDIAISYTKWREVVTGENRGHHLKIKKGKIG